MTGKMFLPHRIYDPLFYAADGQLFWIPSEDEYRNRLAVVFDGNTVKGLVMAGFLKPSSVVCSVSTAPGWVPAIRLDLTEVGWALFDAQQPTDRGIQIGNGNVQTNNF